MFLSGVGYDGDGGAIKETAGNNGDGETRKMCNCLVGVCDGGEEARAIVNRA